MIFTSNYENAKKGNLASISMDGGKRVGFEGEWIKELAPNENIYKHWNNNEEWDQYYINQYYYQVLKHNKYLLDQLKNKYEGYQQDIILLSYAKPEEFSHRYLVSSYLEIKYGIVVPELFIDEYGNYITTTKKPKYTKDKLLRLVRIDER